ncbi:hypothetical protein N7472_008629 [Penicillium cf. griseofulvum]|uniref:Uncharacterized protein n=1 Tax=Penicillium cf. griseofulvum TaxID=2972120 RepID=A0A9W9J7B0_9EURO|nr:hypothetical protein N7472_008629 [Penicillium cf. griseofulvum]KAJ5453183.1 hypothetical protein N7445_001366 [Penicillium cf. griseofulvum]
MWRQHCNVTGRPLASQTITPKRKLKIQEENRKQCRHRQQKHLQHFELSVYPCHTTTPASEGDLAMSELIELTEQIMEFDGLVALATQRRN